jgi:hypothetical protein
MTNWPLGAALYPDHPHGLASGKWLVTPLQVTHSLGFCRNLLAKTGKSAVKQLLPKFYHALKVKRQEEFLHATSGDCAERDAQSWDVNRPPVRIVDADFCSPVEENRLSFYTFLTGRHSS